MRLLVFMFFTLMVIDITVWAILSWKCWRVGGPIWSGLAGVFLALSVGFAFFMGGLLAGRDGSMFRTVPSALGMMIISAASWAFLLYLTGRNSKHSEKQS